MITALVQFRLPSGTGREEAAELFRQSAPRYRDMPGLVRKYYLFAEDGPDGEPMGGGVYLWNSRAEAEAVYNADWRAMIAERYGEAPVVTYFHTPVIVDNERGEILVD